ncbi:MAG: alcohol dehydrogenase catalytic domain-containing protein [Candidatus Limnocylindrales bacterium]|jgi:threonine dehydrogenase-like Zn-dependent dehydrogenase
MSRAMVVADRDRFGWVDLPDPVPAAGEVVVRALYTGLCGTDLHIVEGSHPRARFPLAIGHEIAARPESGPLAGRTVLVDPLLPCGACPACAGGAPNACARLRLIGIDRHGALAGWVAVAETRLHLVPEEIPLEAVPLAEPLAVAVHAVGRVPNLDGRLAVVIGAGPVGLLVAHVARRAGARVLIGEPAPARRAVAIALGFELLEPEAPAENLEALTDGALADVVFDAAAAPAVAANLHRFVHSTGVVAIVGSYGGLVPLDLQAVMFKELTIRGHRTYLPADIDAAIELLRVDAPALEPLRSGVVAADEIETAISAMRRGEGMKFVVECPA